MMQLNPSNHLTPDGSIDPISNFLDKAMHPAPTVYKFGKEMIVAACKSHPFMQKICQQGIENFESLKPKNALVLTSNYDDNGAFQMSFFQNAYKMEVFQQLEEAYNVKYRRVSDIRSFCMAIDEETAENGPIDLLIIRAHGNQNRITLDKDSYFWIGDHLPKNSCLNHLPPKATVVIDSCSTGKGREDHDNFANYLSEHCPSGTRIFSSTIDIHGFVIPQTDPVEIRFHLYLEAKEEYTYVIDPIMTTPCLPSATEYRDQSLHSTDPKVIEIVKKTYEKVIDILPTKMEVAITDPAHLKKAAILISHPIGEEGIKAGVSLKVNNLSHTSLQVSKELPKGTTVGLNFSPLHPKETTLSLPIGTKVLRQESY